VGDNAAHPGTGLNAGDSITVTGPAGALSAPNTSSGGYFMTKSPATLGQGTYTFASTGGSDVGPFTTSLTMAAPPIWTNMSAYTGPVISTGGPLTFTWTGANGYVTVRVASANSTYDSVVRCNVTGGAGTFTIPAFLMRALYASPAIVSLTSGFPAQAFNVTGLDSATVSGSATIAVQTTLPPVVP
jgi:hypothetical protein